MRTIFFRLALITLAGLFLISCGGDGKNTVSETSSHKIKLENLYGRKLLVSSGADYYSVSDKGYFKPKNIGNTFIVYDKNTKQPLFFSYANNKNIIIDEYSTAFFLATEFFPPISRADGNTISKYNKFIKESPELTRLSKKILESIDSYGKINRDYIHDSLLDAHNVFKNEYKNGIIRSESADLSNLDEKSQIKNKELKLSYPKHQGIIFQDVEYTKNNNNTYTVNLTVRNENPAYLSMKLADVNYNNGKYTHISTYNQDAHIIDAGNTSSFYKSFSTFKGLKQLTSDISYAIQLSKEHGVVSGLANATSGSSSTKIKNLILSCKKDAVVISANDTLTLVTNSLMLFFDSLDIRSRMSKAVKQSDGIMNGISAAYSNKDFLNLLIRNIATNKLFIKKAIVHINNRNFSDAMKYYITEEFIKDVLLKEMLHTLNQDFGMNKEQSDVVISLYLGYYNVVTNLSIKTLIGESLGVLSESIYKYALKRSGLDSAIGVTKKSLDLLTYSIFLSSNYEIFFHPFEFIQCDQNPNIAKVINIKPSKSRSDKMLFLRIHGHNLDKISNVKFNHCHKVGRLKLINNLSAVVECFPMENEEETNVTVESDGNDYFIGIVKFYNQEAKITSLSLPERILENEKSIIEINGSNLFKIETKIEDCRNIDTISYEKYANIISCEGFHSSGVKRFTISNNKKIIFETYILISSANKPKIFSSDISHIDQNKTSKITVYGDNLIGKNGEKLIDFKINGCSRKENIFIDEKYLSFDCYPNNSDGSIIINFNEKGNQTNKLIKNIKIIINKKSEVISTLTMTSHKLPNAHFCVNYKIKLEASGGVPPYKWSNNLGMVANGCLGHEGKGYVLCSNPLYMHVSPEGFISDENCRGQTKGKLGAVVEDSKGNKYEKIYNIDIIDNGLKCICKKIEDHISI